MSEQITNSGNGGNSTVRPAAYGERVVVLVGNPRPASRTHTVAVRAAQALAPDATPHVIDLTGLAPVLLGAQASVAVEDAVEQVSSAGLLIVASPTYKGTYRPPYYKKERFDPWFGYEEFPPQLGFTSQARYSRVQYN